MSFSPFPRLTEGRQKTVDDDDDDAEFELDDYDSDEGSKPARTRRSPDSLSAETLALLDKLGAAPRPEITESSDNEVCIFYCSRTHSQLSQFADELRRVRFPPAIPTDHGEHESPEAPRHVPLASRKNLCVNPKVAALGNSTAINERCLELQKSGVAADKRCSYLARDNDVAVADFRDHVLAEIRDIEDIGRIGRRIGVCPYYAARSVIPHAEVLGFFFVLLFRTFGR